ncbi:hypothetical protein IH824_19345, partial [candidate division KSB1 bacterium]|nr:hypothetical protein [candidate division KSB1 bacterium]
MKPLKKTSVFQTEPLKSHVIKIKQAFDSNLAQALNKNITKQFLEYLRFALDKKENINLQCCGRTRSGKSLAMLSLCMTIAEYT